jgi:uncharacterized protein (DUF433 family)
LAIVATLEQSESGFQEMALSELIGMGTYTPAEASQLIGVPSAKIVRWLRGHNVGEVHYPRLWRPQIDLDDGRVYLGFRDLMEARVADVFISRGLSPQKVRRAIELASEMLAEERPLSTARFRTDGRTVFLQVLQEGGVDQMIDLFRSQHVFREIIEPSVRNIELDDSGLPIRWWPRGKQARIVVDPQRVFGQPIEADSGVPTSVLSAACEAEGSLEKAARVWDVPVVAIRRAVEFQSSLPRAA